MLSKRRSRTRSKQPEARRTPEDSRAHGPVERLAADLFARIAEHFRSGRRNDPPEYLALLDAVRAMTGKELALRRDPELRLTDIADRAFMRVLRQRHGLDSPAQFLAA